MHGPTYRLAFFVFGIAIITGTLVAQYFEPRVSPWPGIGAGFIVLAGPPAVRAVALGIARVVANASQDQGDDRE